MKNRHRIPRHVAYRIGRFEARFDDIAAVVTLLLLGWLIATALSAI